PAPSAPRPADAGQGSIPRRAAGEPAPLRFGQERLLLIDQLQPGLAAYNVSTGLRIHGVLDIDALRRALAELARRHEALRTRLAVIDGAPAQVVDPAGDVHLPIHDLSGVAAKAREDALRRHASGLAARPFDLAADLPLRASLVRVADDEHALLLVIHHTAIDGWSVSLLFRELDALYTAFARGEPSPLAPLPIQYADFAAWQRAHLSGDELDRQLAWWRERLAGLPELLEIPSDRPRPAVMSHRGGALKLAFGRDVAEAVRGLARRGGATVFMTLLAGLQALLHRYTGEADFAIGTPVAGRTRPETEGLVGLFLNTLVLRADVSADPDFRALLGRVREATLDAWAHQETPFERLVEALGVERSLGHNPLFQVVFALQNAGDLRPRLDGLDVERFGVHGGGALADLTLSLVETEDAIEGLVEYATDLFDAPTVERMVGHFRALLLAAAADPSTPVTALPLLGDAERATLAAWSRNPMDAPRQPVLEMIAARVAEAPDAVAIEHDEARITYAQLDARANRIARRLLRLDVDRDARVCLCLPRTPDLVAAALGVMKAGGAYVPVEPHFPAERIETVMRDAGAVAFIASSASAGMALPEGCAFVNVADPSIDSESADDPRVEIHPEQLAHVIYTSGSTGRPKGVMIRHGGVATFLAWMRARFPLARGEKVLGSTSAAFDVHAAEVHYTLASGGTLVLVENALSLAELPRDEALVQAGMVPGAARELLAIGALPGSIRRLNLAGEAVPPDLVRALYAAGVPEVHNLYGPTEDTTYSTHAHLPPDGRVTIGRQIGGSRAYVLDARMQPTPVGVPGGLYLAGGGVARGYLGRADLTAEKFIPDPWGAPGERMYATGDRARWLPDGEIEYLGRGDFQVKVRGFRIEPGEIETVLRAHPAVADAAVLARGEEAHRRLVAYVVARDGVAAASAELAAWVRARLPEYMVPAAVLVMDVFPRTSSGKLDRRALPDADFVDEVAGFVAPRTEMEALLAGIWAEVLGRDGFGVTERFWDVGGHSLLAMRVAVRIRAAARAELPLRHFFEAPTIAALAERIERLLREDGAADAVDAIAPRASDGPAPLSFAQERLLLIDQLQPGLAAYNIPTGLRIRGAPDVDALHRALNEIVRRHASLRTRLVMADGAPVQVIDPAGDVRLPLIDLSMAVDVEAEFRAHSATLATRSFDLAADHPLRASLVRLGEDEHALLLVMHHTAIDGWGVSILFRELAALYKTYKNEQESELAPLRIQYADFAAWQRAHLDGAELDRQVAWWRERLAGLPELLEIPADRPRPAVKTYRGAVHRLSLPRELADALRALARREDATLFMTLLAGFQALLHRYTGDADFAVGSPVAGRTRPETEGLIGLFVNTLVLRADVGGEPDFRELLGRVRETTLGAWAHQDVPFERLVDELHVGRSLGHNPLFQVVFQLQNVGDLRPRLDGLDVERVGVHAGSAQFDLGWALTETAGGIEGVVEYSTDLFDAATVERMAEHFRALLEAAAADPSAPVAALPLITADERAALAAWSGAETACPADSIDRIFAACAAATPTAVALEAAGERMTYAELDARANRLARHLRRLGVAHGTRVGLMLERGPAMIEATLATLKAGGAYVPLDPRYPADRLAYMLADAAPAVVVSTSKLADRLPAHGGRTVLLDADLELVVADDARPLESVTGPESVAYVMYTSGSTGTPKGVEVPHRAVVRLVRETDFIRIDPSEVYLQLAPASFDAATLELWGPLLNGARLALYPPDQPTVEGIAEAIARHGVTTLWLTAGLFHLIVDERIDALRPVRQLLAGGDVLSVAHVRRVLDELPDTTLINGYGPTENTTFTACHTIRAEDVERGGIPIGRPIAGTRILVLDGRMQPVPIGVPGELCAAGWGLARGYLNAPELTAEKFVTVTIDGREERIYRTGDRVRWTRGGVLEFLGRMDQQVKIRGYRVEPGEIEAVLRAHPSVADVSVITREDVPGDRRLVAYVVSVDGDTVDAAELRAHLLSRLPAHMVPSAYVGMDALPLTANGKVDRRALPAPELVDEVVEFVAPRTETEALLAGIWGEVLGRERVGVTEAFWEIGGHSLRAMQIAARLRDALRGEVPLRLFFETPTIAEFAARLAAVETEPGGVERAARLARQSADGGAGIVRGTDAGPAPLSFAQERLWLIDQLEPGSAAYTISAGLRLRGALDANALHRAFAEIIRRHDALRTNFAVVDGAPVQVVAPEMSIDIPLLDLSPLGFDKREEALRAFAADEVAVPFNLSSGALVRVRLVRLADDEHALLILMHHAVTDGWSMALLFGELSALYKTYKNEQESQLAPLPIQYADFAAWQRAYLAGDAGVRQVEWWRARLAGLPEVLEIPADRPRPPVASHRGAVTSIDLPRDLADALREVSRREGASLFMTLLAGFSALLHRYTGETDIAVGTPIAGRTRPEAEALIGDFVNTLVLRTDLGGAPRFRELLARVRETTLGAYAHQDLPFERLVDELAPERSLSHEPLFQVLFALQNMGDLALRLDGLQVEELSVKRETARYDLAWALVERDDGIRVIAEYATDLFDEPTVQRMLAHYRALLGAAVADADQPIIDLPLLSDAERDAVVYAWNAADAPYAAGPVHALVSAQAARTPHALAVTGAGEALTYAELEDRANRLAHHLLRNGVVRGEMVAISMERAPSLLVAMLAVWKAGAAYVPIDPAYPEDRRAYMLADSGASVVLADSASVDEIAAGDARVVIVDRLDLAAEAASAPSVAVDADDLAYVIYTSGSTGRPKGVMVPHGGVVNFLASMSRKPGMAADDVLAAVTSLSFDIAVLELLLPLTAGARVVIATREEAMDAPRLMTLLAESGVTVMQATPATWRMLVQAGWDGDARLAILSGGEALQADLARELLPRGRGLWNLYGPTETTIWSAVDRVESAESIFLGHPIANTQLYVLDAALRPCPLGVPGELFIGGDGVVRGYLRRPSLTAERFVPDPFASESGARMYRTGDRVRRKADGALEFLGRIDFQVKVRGFRIELGEIEAALADHPAVRQAVAVVREDAPGDARIVAYVVPDGAAPSTDELRQMLGKRLPDYMVPSAFVSLDAMPLTPNGKVDRKALPAPDWSADADYEAPRTATEQTLAALWCELLDVDRVGRTDGFFALGGHSLRAARLAARVRGVFSIEMPLRAVFEHAPLAELAAEIDRLRAAGTAALPALERVDRAGLLPLSFA
ncbi:MAG TPA: amino acid adenylation domain-containing protein, partial [Longimicrobium sp.]|nr:amino acid adenylation domain-containing protein [Longimicrobium sp.]